MKKKKSKFLQYVKEYKWSNVFTMIKNNKLEPKICNEKFNEKLVVITGATSGIGCLTARKYASHGANLLCVNRDKPKSDVLSREIESNFGVKCSYLIADLSKLSEMHRVAAELAELSIPIDVLIHNAGIYLTKKEVTDDGIEKVFAVHYLSSFIINYYLISKLKQQESARIILVNSEGHRFTVWGLRLDDLNWQKRRYTGLKSYGSAKTAQLLSMIVLDDIFENTAVTINAMHPGAVKTETGQENGPFYQWLKRSFLDKALKSPEVSAEALYYLGAAQEIKSMSGRFYNLTTEEEPAPPALDKEVAYDLWGQSLKSTGLQSTVESE